MVTLRFCRFIKKKRSTPVKKYSGDFVMSTKKQPVAANRAPTNSPAQAQPAPKAKKEPQTIIHEKTTACRLFAFLFLVVGVVAIAFLPYTVLGKEGGMELYKLVMEMVQGGLLLTVTEGAWNIIYNVAIYAFALGLVLATIFSLIALITGKRIVLKAMLAFLNLGAVIYTAVYALTVNVGGVAGPVVDWFSLVLALLLLVATIICVLVTKPTVEVIMPKEEKPKDDGFVLEEYAEAYPYEGGPVAGVVMAEEVNPSFLRHEPHVQTAGYDFYNSKSFDPFIATLNEDERNQFTEIFILRYHGLMPDIPDYKVGGDNAEFFRRIFIYLGQYRDRIPSGLLAKIYQYSLKLS